MSFSIKHPSCHKPATVRRTLGWLGLICAGLLLGGCATPDEESAKAREHGGAIPWNRPESWEGGGVLGSQMSSMQGGM